MTKFEIFFVRHALSCANVWQERGILKAHLRYHDPEITSEGIRKSIALGKKTHYPFKTENKEPFTIGSSVMLRAQQTAYLMFAKPMNQPMFVVPYIGEGFPTVDNMPASEEVQRKRYMSNAAYTEFPSLKYLLYEKGYDFRRNDGSLRDTYPISSFSSFLNWLKNPENKNFFARGSDDIYRAILVTHSGFMKANFPMDGVEKYKNNDGVLVRIRVDEGNPPIYEPYAYIPAEAIPETPEICPDSACRAPPPCKKNGGKRKYTRRNKRRKYQTRRKGN